MKAMIVTEGTKVTMKEGSVVLIFEPAEYRMAVWDLELLAYNFEEKFKKQCGTDVLWEIALELRKMHEIRF